MRAGKLDREITFERATETVDGYGATAPTWAPLATMRAQLIDATTDESIRAFGASTESTVVFRTRYLEGLTVADRVIYEGSAYEIVQLKEIGRRRGLDIRAKRFGP